MRRSSLRRALLRALILAGFSTAAFGYYHFVHFDSKNGPFEPRIEKFDLNALLDRTVFFNVQAEPLGLAKNDSFEAVISQIRQALAVWDSVPTSSLRVAFGGLRGGAADETHPGGEIVFADLPPGVIGLGGPVTRDEARDGFVPIVRSQVILSRDLTRASRPRSSFSELFLNSLVHEIGHALGLQHSLAGSAMSMDVTRATTRALPIAADDIAGLSVLYPTREFQRFFGRVSGRVTTTAGVPVSLASVAAVSPRGAVVSALTDPDGTYRIAGLLPGPHQVYVQPLPPAGQDGLGPANVVLPRAGESFLPAAGFSFKTVFYGGSDRPDRAQPVEVTFGAETAGIDFAVEPSAAAPIHNISTFSFPGNQAPGVHPAFLPLNQPAGFILATGQGLGAASRPVRVEALGGDIDVQGPSVYERDNRFLRIDFVFSAATTPGPKHLLFRTADDISVLPSAVRLTAQTAPIIYWIAEEIDSLQDSLWSVRGVNLDPASQVYFDGMPADIVHFDPEFGDLFVRPPPALPGHQAVVTVYNPDGQSSAFTLPDGNILFSYPEGPTPQVRVAPEAAAPDTDILVEIEGRNTRFAPGLTAVGFGNSDILVRDLDVLGPERLRAVVTVRKGVKPGAYPLTVSSGLQLAMQQRAFRVTQSPATVSGEPAFRFGGLVNSASMRPELSPGVLASLFGRDLTDPGLSADQVSARVRVTFNGETARVISANPRQINLQIPYTAALGKAVVVVESSRGRSRPMLAEIGRVSPGVFGVVRAGGEAVSADAPSRVGEGVALLATGLGAMYLDEAADSPAPQPTIQVLVDERSVKPTSIDEFPGIPGLYTVRFELPEGSFGPQTGATLVVDGRRSNWVRLPVSRVPAEASPPAVR